LAIVQRIDPIVVQRINIKLFQRLIVCVCACARHDEENACNLTQNRTLLFESENIART